MVDPPPPRFIFRINRETVLLSERQIYATCTQRQCSPASVRNILLLSSTCTVFTGHQLHHRSSTAARLRAFENGELTPNQESRFSPSLCGAERGEGNSEGKGLGQTNRPLERRGGHGAQLWPRGVSCVAYKVYHEGVV